METNAVKELSEKVALFNEQNKGLLKEAQDATAEVKRIQKEYADSVAKLNADLAAKDATIGEIQKEVKELQATNGHMKGGSQEAVESAQLLINKSFDSDASKLILKDARLNTPWTTDILKKRTVFKDAGTITIAGNVTGASISAVPTWSREIWARGYDETHFRDIFRVVDTETGLFAFFRSKIPAGEGSIATVEPGADKPKLDKDLELITVTAKYKAGVADIAKESLQDIPMLQSFLSDELINDYLDKETFDFFSEMIAASTGPNTPAGGSTETIEKIIDYIAAQRKLKNRPDKIIVKPGVWAEILKTKPNDFSLPGGVIVTPSGQVAIVGNTLTVTNTDALPDNKVLVGDSRKIAVMQKIGEGLKLELFQQHDKAVYNNLVTMRVEARVALLHFRLNAFSYGDI